MTTTFTNGASIKDAHATLHQPSTTAPAVTATMRMSPGPNARRLESVCPALYDVLGAGDLIAVLDYDDDKGVSSENDAKALNGTLSSSSSSSYYDPYWQQVHLQFIFRVLVNRTLSELAVATLQRHKGDANVDVVDEDDTQHRRKKDNDLPYPNVTPAQLSERLHLFRDLLQIMERRLATSTSDRGVFLTKLAHAYHLTAVEVRVVQFLVTAKVLPSPSVLELLLPSTKTTTINAASSFASYGGADETMACEHDTVRYVCGATALDWSRLANQDHVLCSDRVLVFQGEEDSLFENSKLSVSVEACRAIMGMEENLTVEDKLKLSGTKLLSIVLNSSSSGRDGGSGDRVVVGEETTTTTPSMTEKHNRPSSSSSLHREDGGAQASIKKMLSTLHGGGVNASSSSSSDDDDGDAEPVSGDGTETPTVAGAETTLANLHDNQERSSSIQREKSQGETTRAAAATLATPPQDDDDYSATVDPTTPQAYTSELQYLKDQFEVVMQKLIYSRQRIAQDLRKASITDTTNYWMQGTNTAASKSKSVGEISAKIQLAQRKISVSLERTREQGTFFPRLELLVEQLQLDDFEKFVLVYLAGSMISPIFKSCLKSEEYSKYEDVVVGDLLNVYYDSFEEQVAGRTYFYRSSTLARKGLIKNLKGYRQTDLTDQQVLLDRRVLDCIVGLDKESSEISHGSHLYEPKVSLDSVVLPQKMKETIIDAVTHFDQFRRYRKHHPDFDETISYGVGLTLMFCGPSGTGKTITANAIANYLGKKLLLVNFRFLSQSNANDSNQDSRQFQGIFREAELSDAIVFFDECESLFASRSSGGSAETTELLTELERFEGIVFLATNRPYDLDEAMYRRISQVFEFRPPNYLERLDIWRLLTSPKSIPCDPSIDWESIALQYELTGGFIKNAVMSALLNAVGRDFRSPTVRQSDIVEGCKKQVRGSLQMVEFDERVLPRTGLDELVASDTIIGQLREMVSLEKARAILFGSWGFDEDMRNRQGTTALFWGPSGTGRSRAAEAVGFELGKPLKVVDLPRLLEEKKGRNGSGNSAAAIRNIFQEARLMDAVLVLDGFSLAASDGNGSHGAEGDSRSLNLVIREMTRFPGIVIMMVDTVGSLDIFVSRLDKGLISGLKFLVEFQLPSLSSRHVLWKKLMPVSVPVSEEIDWKKLAEASSDFSLAQIGNAIYRAAAAAAMRPETKERLVSMKDLFAAIEEEKHRGESAVDRWVRSQYV